MMLDRIKVLLTIAIFIPLCINAQNVENLHFEQSGKQIIIYYDLTGDQLGQTYDVQIFCSNDGGKTFGSPLKNITGDAGTKITQGIGKKVVWEVLSEREKLEGNVLFEIQIKNSIINAIDIDGNVYKAVIINNQIWMEENLKTTKFNDGTSIPLETDGTKWMELLTPAYCWYNNNPIYKEINGALYNWYTVSTGKLCPKGWHVPTDSEWTVLITFLGGESVAGGKMKEVGDKHWIEPNIGATDEVRFKALPNTYRSWPQGEFSKIGDWALWWSSTGSSGDGAWSRCIFNNGSNIIRDPAAKYFGYTVRCLKDK